MLFSDVVGQSAAKGGIIKMWQHNLLPHAILILGAEGLGGLPMGLALAQYIFCENKGTYDSCGKCASCNKTSKLEHADLHLSFPSIKPKPDAKAMSRHFINDFREFVKQTPYGTTFEWLQHLDAENKQGNITAEECREIIDTLNLKTYEGGSKVMLMWRPEYLGKEGNILLKLIEEPPANTILIFIAEQAEDILATIKSRTQAIKLAPIPASEITTALIERAGADPARAAQVAHLSMGSYSEALKLMRSTDNDLFPVVRQLFNALFTDNGVLLTKFVEDLAKTGREQQKNLLNYVIHLLEHAVRSRYMPTVPVTLPEAEAQFVKKLGNMQIALEGIQLMVDTITNTIYYIERNAHSKTQIHTMAIKLHYIVKNKPIPV